MTEEPQSEGNEGLLARVRENPADVPVTAFIDAASDPAVPKENLATAFRIALGEGVVGPEDATTALVDVITGKQYEKQTMVAPLLPVLAAEFPEALTASADDLVDVATKNDLVVDDLAACFPALARADPEAILPHVDDVVTLLDSDLLPVRHAAVGTLVVLVEAHPEQLTTFAPDVVDLLHRNRPDLAKSIDGVAIDQPRMPESMRDQLSATQFQLHAVREGAAIVLYDLAATDPGAVAPFIDHLDDVLEETTAPQVQKLVVDALELVARDRPDDVAAVRRTAAAHLAGSDAVDESPEGSAARLLATLARTQEAAAVDAIREEDGVAGLADTLDAAETDDRVAAAALFAALGRQGSDVSSDAVDALETAARTADSEALREEATAALDEIRH